ncbi:MAG: putative lipid II flippase FtsW [Coxiella sp. (in: Bacteria)]|nr:MAG: putative lipid II flippase FtsW [Coxiella sp. (in: g-proteobacteria)]
MQRKRNAPVSFDGILITLTLLLVAFGLVMVASSSMVISDQQYGYPFHYLVKQAIFIGMGFVAALIMTRVPQQFWEKYSLPLLGIGIVLLLAVLVPGIGRSVNGSRRWLNFGFIGFQVSEVIKLCAFIYLASYLARFQDEVQTTLKGFIKPMLLLGVMAVLLLLEPNFGSVVVITAVFLAVLFLAGARIMPFLLLIIVVAGLLGLLAVLSPYRMARLTTFLNPWHNAYGSGYQLTQSLIAFGRGGWFGVGLGNSIQKLFYLPEAHTDFIFAVISEELGLVGELALLGLFACLVSRILFIGRRAMLGAHLFSGYFCYAVALWFAFQVVVNVGVCAGLLPTKGLTLPFISYGGSSVLVNCLVIGIVLRVAHESSGQRVPVSSRVMRA